MVYRWELKDESNKEQLKRKYRMDKVWERPERYQPDVESGHYLCFQIEINEIRRALLTEGIVPKLTMRSLTQIRSMSWNRINLSVLCDDWEKES